MLKLALLSCAGLVFIAAGCTQKKSNEAALQTLVAAERQFAQMALDENVRDAFLGNLADDAVLFNPKPTNGKALYEARPVTPARLEWRPSFADVAASGDLGYTTGPWQFRRDSSSALIAFGHFTSVWKKQADNNWKVVLDIGISHPEHEGEEPLTLAKPRVLSAAISGSTKADDLLKAESDFSKLSATEGRAAAFQQFASANVRLNKEGTFPLLGRAAAVAELQANDENLSWEAGGHGISSAGDFGYVYGLATPTTAASDSGYSYLHVWTKTPGTGWQILAEVTNPLSQ